MDFNAAKTYIRMLWAFRISPIRYLLVFAATTSKTNEHIFMKFLRTLGLTKRKISLDFEQDWDHCLDIKISQIFNCLILHAIICFRPNGAYCQLINKLVLIASGFVSNHMVCYWSITLRFGHLSGYLESKGNRGDIENLTRESWLQVTLHSFRFFIIID